MRSRSLPRAGIAALAVVSLLGAARAQTLTPYALANGFTLEPWAVAFPTGPVGCTMGPTFTCAGPLGIAYRPDLAVLVTTIDGNLRLFSTFTPVGGPPQLASGATIVGSYGFGNALGLAQIPVAGPGSGFSYYMAQQSNGLVVEIAPGGGPPIRTVATVPMATGIIPFPSAAFAPGTAVHAGHLFVSQGFGGASVFEIDPALPAATAIVATYAIPGTDGMSFSPSGELFFTAGSLTSGADGVRVYDTATMTLLYQVPLIDPDGIAVGGGALTGKAYANCNDGTVQEFVYDVFPGVGPEFQPPGAPIVNAITGGGTRGDFVVTEPIPFTFSGGPTFFGPSLVITQSDSLWRIDPVDSCFYGPPLYDQPLNVGPGLAYCAGDGLSSPPTAPCPCGNFGAAGNGCSSSFNPAGAHMDAAGATSVDNVVLQGSGMTATGICIFIQGSAIDPNGFVFGDGMTCTAGSLLRLRGVALASGAASFPVPPETITLSARGGVIPGSGVERSYSVYYRNAAAAFCPPFTFNIANSYRITW